MKKPACRICRSRKWRQSSSGYLVCEFGHQLEGHQIELGEFDPTPGAISTIRKGNAHKRKRQATTTHRIHLVGPSAEDLFRQAMQLILRKQLYVLIHDFGFPPELEVVAHEYWTLYISEVSMHQDTGKVQHSKEANKNDSDMNGFDEKQSPGRKDHDSSPTKEVDHSQFRDKTTLQEANPDAVDRMGEYQGYGTDESESSSESDQGRASSLDSDDDEEEEEDMSDAVEEDEDEGEDEGEDDILAGASLPHERVRPKNIRASDPKILMIIFTLVICYFSATHFKLPVVLGDFTRWAQQRKIPYFGAINILPPEMCRRLPWQYRKRFYPRDRDPNRLRAAATRFHFLLRRSYGVYPNMPNTPPLIFRFVQELMLPIEVFPCALSLSRILFDETKQGRMYGFHQCRMSVHGSTYVMAVVIAVAKLFLGLDGKARSADNHLSWVDAMPKEQDWIESLNIFDSIQAQTSVHGAFGEFEALMEVNPDLYHDYATLELRFSQTSGFHDLLGVFQTTEYDRRAQEAARKEGLSPAIEAFIKRLHSNVKPPEVATHDDMAPPPLKHGEGFVHYVPQNTGAYLGTYERLLSYASNVLAMQPGTLQTLIDPVEQHLLMEPRGYHVRPMEKWVRPKKK